MKKALSLLLACGLSVSLLAGCGGPKNPTAESQAQAQTQTQAPLREKHLIFGDTTFNPENAEPDVNPHNDYAGWAAIRYGLGETLFRYTDKMEIEPWLAASYELADPLTWKITLKEKLNFSNGEKVDAEAVKACLEHLIEVHERAKGDLDIDKIEAEGLVLTIHTKSEKPALLNYLSDPYGCIIDMKAGISPEGVVIATGPFKVDQMVPGEKVELSRNENYWNGEVKLDKVTVRTITDGDTMTLALQAGEIDAAYGMPYVSYPLFPKDKYTFSSTSTSRAFYAWMNFKSPIIQDAAVRKAIAMGIDKQGFVDNLLQGNGYVGNAVFPAGLAFGGDQVKTESYDPEGAKKVLEEAGWTVGSDGIRQKDGVPLKLRWLTYPSRQELPLLAEAAQASLKDLGIAVEINSTADHNKIRKDPGKWDIYASAMVTAPTGDPEYFFTTCTLDSSAVNVGAYHSDKLEELAGKMAKTFDAAERAKLAIQMQQTILDDNAYVFCSFLKMTLLSKANVKNLTAHPCDFYELTANVDMDLDAPATK